MFQYVTPVFTWRCKETSYLEKSQKPSVTPAYKFDTNAHVTTVSLLPYMTSALNSFPPQCRVAVVGASGGIGQALVALFANDVRVERVLALSRTPCPVSSPKITQGDLNIESEASIANCAASLSSEFPLDIVVVATGILWDGDQLSPEKSMRD